MNRPSAPEFSIGNIQISSSKFYQITINGQTSTVPGRHIRSRKSKAGYSIKINGQRRAYRPHYTLVEVTSGVSASAGAAYGGAGGASGAFAASSYNAVGGGSYVQNGGSYGGCGRRY